MAALAVLVQTSPGAQDKAYGGGVAVDKMLTFDQLRVGTVYPPVTYRFHPDQVSQWTAAFGYDAPSYNHAQAAAAVGFGAGAVVPPALSSVYVLHAYMQAYQNRPRGNIHAKQEFVWYHPVRVNEEISTEVTLVDKFIKRRRRYVVTETRTTNPQGQLVATSRVTTIFAQ